MTNLQPGTQPSLTWAAADLLSLFCAHSDACARDTSCDCDSSKLNCHTFPLAHSLPTAVQCFAALGLFHLRGTSHSGTHSLVSPSLALIDGTTRGIPAISTHYGSHGATTTHRRPIALQSPRLLINFFFSGMAVA